MEKKSKILIGLGVALIAVIAALVVYKQTTGKERQAERDLELATEYLDELDYEQAIATYERVLEIDAANTTAMVGLSQAYIGLAEDDLAEQEVRAINYEKAVGYAENAWQLEKENIQIQSNLQIVYTDTADFFDFVGDTERSEHYHELAAGLSGGEESAIKVGEVGDSEKAEETEQETAPGEGNYYSEDLQEILEAYQTGDIDRMIELAGEQKYMDLVSDLAEGESFYCGEYRNEVRDVIGVAVYSIWGE